MTASGRPGSGASGAGGRQQPPRQRSRMPARKAAGGAGSSRGAQPTKSARKPAAKSTGAKGSGGSARTPPSQRTVRKSPVQKNPIQKSSAQKNSVQKSSAQKVATKRVAGKKGQQGAAASRTVGHRTPGLPGREARPVGPRPPRRQWLPRPRTGDPDRRLRAALLVALFVFSLFAGRLIQLQGLEASPLAEQALAQRWVERPLPAHRGDIIDASGAVLARTVERRNITVDQSLVPEYGRRRADLPESAKGVHGAAKALAPLLGMSVSEVRGRIAGTKRWAYVAKDVEPDVWRRIARLAIPGIFAQQASRRNYPAGQVGASLLGFVGKDGVPRAGVELSRDDELAGVDGVLRYERSRDGTQIPTGLSQEVEPRPGRIVQLTIDRDLQWKTQKALTAAVRQTKARSGYAVALDPTTGDVLSLASVPTFDSNNPGAVSAGQRENRALIDVFEPGSTSKVITAAAALEEKLVTPATRFRVDDSVRRGGKVFHDSHSHAVERLTFAGVLAQSSNVGTILAGEKVAPARMYDYLKRFGLGSTTGVGLPESRGILADAKDWSRSQRYTVLFGQGLSVTALQAAGVFATIANDGVRVSPRLVKGVSGDDGKIRPTAPGARTQAVSAATAQQVRLMLESVVGEDGTAIRASIPGYRVAGKTGTAEAYDDTCGCYRGYTASFIGMAPAEKPRIVVAVFLQQPKQNYYGGVVAAPVFQQVMTYALAARGVPPSGSKPPKLPLRYR